MLERLNEKLGSKQKVIRTVELTYSLSGQEAKHDLSINKHEPLLLSSRNCADSLFWNKWICVTTFSSLCDGFSSYGDSKKQAVGYPFDFCYLLSGLRRDYLFYMPGSDESLGDVIEDIIESSTPD